MSPTHKTPITIITGFVGSGKTSLILNLIPQLRASNPTYSLALIKNEIGDVAIDTQLAAAAEMTGVAELLGDCICCTNIGQIGEALKELETRASPDRVIIETSGSAEPAKLALEVKRLGSESGKWELDGVVSVIDVENWGGYKDTSFTAKLQAKQTDLIVLNKWEEAGEERLERVLDGLGDMDLGTPVVKSKKGWVSVELLFGLDGKMAEDWVRRECDGDGHVHGNRCGHEHGGERAQHTHDHNEEMECLSITFAAPQTGSTPAAASSVNLQNLEKLLKAAPKDEVYRIKAVVYSSDRPADLESIPEAQGQDSPSRYILNWSFGRWTWTRDTPKPDEPAIRMSIFTARYESKKWQKRIEAGTYTALSDESTQGELTVKRVL